MDKCLVPGCQSQVSQTPNLKFHRFPNRQQDQTRFNAWIKKVQINLDDAEQKNASVCSLHFTEDDFSANEMSEQLKETAVPTQLLCDSTTKVKIECPRIFVCRLCANPRNASDMLDKQDSKIQTFLSSFLVSWSEEDALLPKSICRVCVCKLNETIRFQAECLKAATKLKSQRSDLLIPKTEEFFEKFEFISTFTDWPESDVEESMQIESDLEEKIELQINSELEEIPTNSNQPLSRWKCLLCNQFTASKAEVKRHYPKCKSFYNRFVKNKHEVKLKKNPPKKTITKHNQSSDGEKVYDRKYICRFNNQLAEEFPFLKLKDPSSECDVFCNICQRSFSIAYKGRGSIRTHMKSGKHQNAVQHNETF